MRPSVDPYSFQAKEKKLYLGVGLALLVVAILIGLIGAGVFGLGLGQKGIITQATGPKGSSVTRVEAPPSPAVTGVTGEPAPSQGDALASKKMPEHDLDWLKHLERIEKRRKDLSTQQIASLLTQLTMLEGVGASTEVMKGLLGDDPDVENKTPSQEIGEEARQQKEAWKKLIEDFDSLPPPTECVPIRNAYAQCLGETQEMLTEVLDAFRLSDTDPKAAVNGLMKLRGKSHTRIDIAGHETDVLVQDICDRYAVRKWFSISNDVGGGMSGVLGGLDGLIGH